MKNYIVITGGAGFVGSNLIEFLLKKQIRKLFLLITILVEQKKITSILGEFFIKKVIQLIFIKY